MKVLIANVGSTSLKYGLYDMPSEQLLARGRMERVGAEVSPCETWAPAAQRTATRPLPDFAAAIDYLKTVLTEQPSGVLNSLHEIDAVGFKVVHARGYSGCQVLDAQVI